MPRPRYHAAVSLGVAALLVARTRRWQDAVPVLAAGVLVDFDHLVDLAATRATGKPEWIIVPLHAWEWVFGLLARHSRRADNLAAGLAAHLALDQLNPTIRHPLFYWLVVRIAYRFSATSRLVYPRHLTHGAKWMTDSPLSWF
jgi:hypothetical protein